MSTTSTHQINFTQGSILRNVIAFSIPLVLGELLQNLYNMADAFVVGNYVGENALAAVTVCSVAANMIVNFFNGMSVGANVVVARAFGAGDKSAVERSAQIAFTFAVFLGIALSLLGILFAPQLLAFANAQPEYYDDALLYLRIYISGLLFTVIYNSGAGILRAMGASHLAFYILAAACVINITLDFLFAAVLSWGIAGVGLATILAQGISAVCVYCVIGRKIGQRAISLHRLRHGVDVIASVLSIGAAAGLQSALIGISNLFVVRYMNLFDTATVAGIGIAQKVDRIAILPVKSFGMTMTTFVGQNLGAQKPERIQEGRDKTLLLGLGVTVSLSALAFFFAENFVLLFNRDAAVVASGTAMIRMMAPFVFILCVREVFTGYLRGFGKSIVPSILSLIGMVGVRQIYLAVTMSREVSVVHIYRCYPIAWFAATSLLVGYYLLVRKKLHT